MRDQAHVLEILPFEQVDDVGDVGVEGDVLAEKMRAVRKPGQRRREDLVTLGFEKVRDALPAPAAVPCAVNEHEGLACSRLGHCVAPVSACLSGRHYSAEIAAGVIAV